jgi:hypothetical protein
MSNRRMVPAMGTTRHTFCQNVQLPLTIGLLIACVANLALVYAWL